MSPDSCYALDMWVEVGGARLPQAVDPATRARYAVVDPSPEPIPYVIQISVRPRGGYSSKREPTHFGAQLIIDVVADKKSFIGTMGKALRYADFERDVYTSLAFAPTKTVDSDSEE